MPWRCVPVFTAPWTMRPLDDASLGRCVPVPCVFWTMCPLGDVFIGSWVPEWWVSTLDSIQAVDNHESYSKKLEFLLPPWLTHALLTYPDTLTASSMRMRSSRVVRASDCLCRSRNSPGFHPSILRHSGILRAVDEAVLMLNTVHRKKNLKVHKIENFFGSDFEFCVISLFFMLKY